MTVTAHINDMSCRNFCTNNPTVAAPSYLLHFLFLIFVIFIQTFFWFSKHQFRGSFETIFHFYGVLRWFEKDIDLWKTANLGSLFLHDYLLSFFPRVADPRTLRGCGDPRGDTFKNLIKVCQRSVGVRCDYTTPLIISLIPRLLRVTLQERIQSGFCPQYRNSCTKPQHFPRCGNKSPSKFCIGLFFHFFFPKTWKAASRRHWVEW